MSEIEARKEEIKKWFTSWFSNKQNIYLLLILIAAFAIRFYYFTLTKSQPLWWDEAEYGLRAKAFAFGTPISGWAPERELIVPLLFAFLLKLGATELALRFVQIIVSFSTVVMTYVTISKIANKKIGLYATFGMAFFWLHIFFTERVLMYLWAPLLFLIIAYFFCTGYLHDNKKHLIAFAFFASLGLQIYFSIGFLLFGLGIYMFMTEGFSMLKNKKSGYFLIIFLIVFAPYGIYSQITYGFPIPRLAIGFTAVTQESGAGLSGLLAYINMFPSRVGWVFTLLSFFGLGYFLLNLVLGIGIKDHMKKHASWLLLFISFLVPFALYTLYGTIGGSATFYDAFILPVFPFAFAFAGLSLEKIENYTSKYGKNVALGIIIALLFLHAYSGITNSDATIKAKITSYDSVKYAGLWIKDHSSPGDIIISKSRPQNTYYSERATYGFGESEQEFEKIIIEDRPKYVVDSVWENTAPWIHDYPQKHQDRFVPVQAYFSDQEKKHLSLIIYEVKY